MGVLSLGCTTMIIGLWLAVLIDLALGEPPVRWHPVVWMGRYLDAMGLRIAPTGRLAARASAHHALFLLGALGWLAGALLVVAAAMLLQSALGRAPWWLAVVGVGVVVKPMFSARMLCDEVLAVEQGLGQNLEQGRKSLSRLVSRDVQSLSASGVRESAIESLAENLNDSMVAPLFWFVLAGIPGAALYRYANTADAMWGYLGTRGGRDWTWVGKWAARADDVLSWIPARLTAVLLALVAMRWPAGLRAQAARTPSPNGGWPMACMALLTGLRLAKPGVYILNEQGREPDGQSISQSVRLAVRAMAVMVLLATAITLVIGVVLSPGSRTW